MKENAKKFLEEVSKNEALKAELTAAQAEAAKAEGKDLQAASINATIKVAAKHGVTLTVEDFESPKMAVISEEELKAVAGGANYNPKAVTSVCRCDGYGSGLTWELDCQCHDSGNGYNATNGHWRCGCTGQGLGLA